MNWRKLPSSSTQFGHVQKHLQLRSQDWRPVGCLVRTGNEVARVRLWAQVFIHSELARGPHFAGLRKRPWRGMSYLQRSCHASTGALLGGELSAVVFVTAGELTTPFTSTKSAVTTIEPSLCTASSFNPSSLQEAIASAMRHPLRIGWRRQGTHRVDVLCLLDTVNTTGCLVARRWVELQKDSLGLQGVDAPAQVDQGTPRAVARLDITRRKATNGGLADASGLSHRVLRQPLIGEVLDEVFPHG